MPTDRSENDMTLLTEKHRARLQTALPMLPALPAPSPAAQAILDLFR
jgi:hypothetical protein